MKIRNILSLCALVFFAFNGFSQTTSNIDYKKGEILVQLKAEAELGHIISDYKHLGIKTKQIVSKRFNIYLLEFDESKSNNASILNSLKSNSNIINAQNNHYLSERNMDEIIPNDEYFTDQWSFNNTGQNGGLLDADIDATNAWDISTGGLTADGDTIVIAIIDSGSDINSEDIDFWKNISDIPANGIDDDENGYIDDYDGWNSLTHNSNITLGNHGIHVTGIAAAIGNNEIGVAGINWGAKVLPVIGSSTVESVVVEALSFVYTVRETYDMTNGEQGAFVVADNCSFGIDGGQPEDYPIWEAMYDSLGRLGVISVGATANRNWDVDVEGDIPSAFTTDFMISVTNTTNTDNLFVSAAYGDTAIDLGAPGTQIKSLYINNNIGVKTGTSMAAPHVTGSVALLFATADADFISNYKLNPAEGAVIIKQHILNGTDALESLQGKTLTGGRLNIFNSINKQSDAPVLFVEQDEYIYEMLTNSILNESALISNNGTDDLNYSITFNNNPNWISVESNSGIVAGGESAEIFFTIDNSSLDTGYYETIMNVSGSDFFDKTIIIGMHIFDYLNVDINSELLNVKVFPNPFKNSLNIDLNISGESSIEIFDQFGKLVYQNEIQNHEKINFPNNLINGFYYYQIKTSSGVSNGKLIKSSF